MSKITLTISDLDLGEDTYHVGFLAEGSLIEEGHATAAYFVGYYLHTLVSDPDFLKDVGAYGKALIDGMVAAGHNLAPMLPAKCVLILEDEDLNTGRYKPSFEMHGGDPKGQRLPTTAQIMGSYMRALINDAKFQLACWKFAEDYVAANDACEIVNIEQAPSDDAARAA